MKVSEILQDLQKAGLLIDAPEVNPHDEVVGLTDDSRQAALGTLFIATRGSKVDSHDLVSDLSQKKIVCVVDQNYLHRGPSLIVVKDTKHAKARIAQCFYRFPSSKMKIVGVTGTSGKTSTTFFIYEILKKKYGKVGLLGTIFSDDGRTREESALTTLGSLELAKKMHQMVENGCQALVMEVSSHALDQKRVEEVAFDVVGFTNLSRDHLDYHKTMENYFDSKKRLFVDFDAYSSAQSKKIHKLISPYSEYGKKLRLILNQSENETKFSLEMNECRVEAHFGDKKIQTQISGNFQKENLWLAIQSCLALGLSEKEVAEGLRGLRPVPGRLERVNSHHKMDVFVDYAHKPEAVEKVLQERNEEKKGKIITVLGCGGDRDPGKRPLMAKIAVQYSDFVVFTSDNPRSEDPLQIIRDMTDAVSEDKNKFVVEVDRRKAIELAIQKASLNDCVMILGKGHETYQVIGDQKRYFDDRKVAEEFLSKKVL